MAGIAPIFARLAHHYMLKGEGRHECTQFGYTDVLVETDTEWSNHALAGDPPAYFSTVRVSFFDRGKRCRWLEFKVSAIGMGGDPHITDVSRKVLLDDQRPGNAESDTGDGSGNEPG